MDSVRSGPYGQVNIDHNENDYYCYNDYDDYDYYDDDLMAR